MNRKNRVGFVWSVVLLAVISFGAGALADNLTVTITDNVLRSGVIPAGLNFGSENTKLTVSDNFEGTLYRQALTGILYKDSFVPYYADPKRAEEMGWNKVYVGGTYKVFPSKGQAATGTVVSISADDVNIWGTGKIKNLTRFKFDRVVASDAPETGYRNSTMLFERNNDDEGFFPKPGWWVSDNCSIAAENVPDLFGKSSLKMDGTGKEALYRMKASKNDVTDVNTEWLCQFWVKATEGSPQVTVQWRDNHKIAEFTPSDKWEHKEFSFTVSGQEDRAEPIGELLVRGGAVLVDNIEYMMTGDENPTAFHDDFIEAMKMINPGVLRGQLTMGGFSPTNRIANPLSWLRGEFHKTYPLGPGILNNEYPGMVSEGYQDFMEMCEEVGAEPWLSVSGTMLPEECAALIEWLAGPVDSTWGKVRADLGHPVPWTDTFKEITLEYGNEAWNAFGPYLAAGSDGAHYWHELTVAAKASPWYTSNISITIGGQAVSSRGAATLMFERNTNADAYCTAPYLMSEYYKTDLAALTNMEMAVQHCLAYSIWQLNGDSNEAYSKIQEKLLAADFESKHYEFNYHTTHGDQAPEVHERVGMMMGSRAQGIALANYALSWLKDYGVNRQCLFKAMRHDGSGVASKVKLWSVIKSFKKGEVALRPSGWAFAAMNKVRCGDLLETVHSPEPTFAAYGRYGGKNKPENFSEKTFNSVYSYAFRDGKTNGLILLNLDIKTDHQVTVNLNAPAADQTAECWELTSDSYLDHNDDPELPNKVKLEESTIQNFQSGAVIELPACGMKVIRWVSK